MKGTPDSSARWLPGPPGGVTQPQCNSQTQTMTGQAVRAPGISREWSKMAQQQIPQGWGVKCRSPYLAGHQPSPIGGGRGTSGHLSLLRCLCWNSQQGWHWQAAHPSSPLSLSLKKRLFSGLKGGGIPAFSYLLLALLNSFLCLFLGMSGCCLPARMNQFVERYSFPGLLLFPLVCPGLPWVWLH